MNELALFAGAGGGILGGHLLGWRTICAVEWMPYPRSVLMQRQNDGILRSFPIWDDVQTFDGKPWAGLVDVVSGGFPCQDISAAGKGAGIDGERSGMWSHMARIIGEVRPCYVLVENSPMLTSRGLGRVLGDLAAMGYDAEWCVLGADDVGAPHKRDRIWVLGAASDSSSLARDPWRPEPARQLGAPWLADGGDDVADPESRESRVKAEWKWWEDPCRRGDDCRGAQGKRKESSDSMHQRLEVWDWSQGAPRTRTSAFLGDWWATEPRLGRVAHVVASRVDRLKAIGNGQVPAVAATAFRILSERLIGKEFQTTNKEMEG